MAIMLWHNRLFMAAEIFRRFRQRRLVYALVSASKDGAWLDGFFSILGLRTVRGSSSNFGRESALLLVDVLRTGNDIGITPDGPRGPCYDFKAGGLVVTRRAHAPVLLLGATFESAWKLNSWDRFLIPRPFSRVRLTGEVISADTLNDRDSSVVKLRERLLAINDDSHAADRLTVI